MNIEIAMLAGHMRHLATMLSDPEAIKVLLTAAHKLDSRAEELQTSEEEKRPYTDHEMKQGL